MSIVDFVLPVLLLPPPVFLVVVHRPLLEQVARHSPDLLVHPSSRGFEWQRQNEGTGEQLRLVLTEEVVRLLEEAAVVRDSIYFVGEVVVVLEVLVALVGDLVAVEQVALVDLHAHRVVLPALLLVAVRRRALRLHTLLFLLLALLQQTCQVRVRHTLEQLLVGTVIVANYFPALAREHFDGFHLISEQIVLRQSVFVVEDAPYDAFLLRVQQKSRHLRGRLDIHLFYFTYHLQQMRYLYVFVHSQ